MSDIEFLYDFEISVAGVARCRSEPWSETAAHVANETEAPRLPRFPSPHLVTW